MSARRKRRRERQRRRHHEGKPQASWPPPRELHKVRDVERLAYSRRQAAEALGVSISTIDRRLVPAVSTVKTPWGQRLIPVAELERFVREHLEPAQRRPSSSHPAGRPAVLSQGVVDRIRLEYARGRGLAEIARDLTTDEIPTAHGGRQWWPSTVRAVVLRTAGE
jgi:Recombinase